MRCAAWGAQCVSLDDWMDETACTLSVPKILLHPCCLLHAQTTNISFFSFYDASATIDTIYGTTWGQCVPVGMVHSNIIID